MSARKSSKNTRLDEPSPSRTFDIRTTRGRRRVSLMVILAGLAISSLHNAGVFDTPVSVVKDISNTTPSHRR